MHDDEKMFHIGAWSIGIVMMLSVTLQVGFRTQNRQINRVRRDIVETQQKIAVAEANFASLVRPEVLRNMVVSILPKVEGISFQKSVTIDDLPNREIL
ncbi:MAG: hypothetical protein Q4C08_01355, partial [Pseudomonadota bacterium]|jgi:hypothetical protein|nr:hypothetical protein [Alphaproteobacteria bacterium]MDO4423427.1 hypothetical protein [Pseudomonadota bacterium]